MSIKKSIKKMFNSYLEAANSFGDSIIQLYTYPINQKNNKDNFQSYKTLLYHSARGEEKMNIKTSIKITTKKLWESYSESSIKYGENMLQLYSNTVPQKRK